MDQDGTQGRPGPNGPPGGHGRSEQGAGHEAELINLAERRRVGHERATPLNEPDDGVDGGENSEDGVTGTSLVALRVARLLKEGETVLIVGDQPRSGAVVPDDSRRYSRIYPMGVRHTERGPKVTGWRSEDGTILGMEDDLKT